MKVLKMIVIVLAVIIAVLTAALFIFLKTFDLNRHLPQITAEASKAIGRDLKIGSATLGLSFSGVILEARDVLLADDPKFSDKPFLSVERVTAGVDVKALVFERKVHVGEVFIVSPRVVIVRSRDGLINAATIAAQPSTVSAPSAAASGAPAAMPLPVLLVSEINITDGTVIYIDEMFTPALALTIDHVNVNIRDLSLTAPFNIIVKAALFSEHENISAKAIVQVDVSKLVVQADISNIDVNGVDMKKAAEALKLPFTMRGMLMASGGIKLSGKMPQELFSSLNGEFKAELKDGVLENVNFLALGLDKIPMLPGLLDSVMQDLPDQTREDVKAGITRLTACKAAARIVNGVLQVDAADLSTPDITAHMTGKIKLVETMELRADIRVTPELSGRLAGRVSELSALKDDQGRLYIPIDITGDLIKPNVKPDMKYLTRKLVVAVGSGQLQKVLGSPQAAQAVDAIFGLFKKDPQP